jgi:dolichyl-diphosphooligosaccharide--protein glycosyltransferase
MRKRLVTVFSFALVLWVNLYYRSFPINFPQFRQQARDIVEERVRANSAEYVRKEYPGLSPIASEGLLDTLVAEYLSRYRKDIAAQVKREYAGLKSRYQDASGQTYLMELDGWHWGRYVENTLRLGHPGDGIENGRQYNDLMLAPQGKAWMGNYFFYYLSAGLYKAFSFFKPAVPLFSFLFYLPLFFTAVFICLLFIFCRKYYGLPCAVIACLYAGLAPLFLQRSYAGWFDTDALNLIFSLLICWAYLLAVRAGGTWRGAAWASVAGALTGLFSYSWTIGWSYIFWVVCAYGAYAVLNTITLSKAGLAWKGEDFRRHFTCLLVYFFSAYLGVKIFSGEGLFRYAIFTQTRDFLRLNNVVTASIWPNVYATVSEFRRPGLRQIAAMSGGREVFAFVLISFLGLFLAALRGHKFKDFQRRGLFLFLIWFLLVLFACAKGVRFVALFLTPAGIALGWALQEARRYLAREKMRLAAAAISGIMLLLILFFAQTAGVNGRTYHPLMNDLWYRTLLKIKEKTPERAIINSWWDFGDWFEAVARRRTIIDGQSQNLPQTYWMAQVLMAKDEKEAVAILRMLNNGANRAFELINGSLNDPFEAVFLLRRLLRMERSAAQAAFPRQVSQQVKEEVIRLIFDRPKDKAYFIVDYTMSQKAPAISFLGGWDFARVFILRRLKDGNKEQAAEFLLRAGFSKGQAVSLWEEAALLTEKEQEAWVSRQRWFYAQPEKGRSDGGRVYFDRAGIIFDPQAKDARLYSCRRGRFSPPKALFIAGQAGIEAAPRRYQTSGAACLIYGPPEGYYGLALDEDLAESMLARLYFLGGAGLKHFKPFIEEHEGEDYIRVFEVIWEE